MNLGWWLESAAWDYGDKVAIVNGDETKVTFLGLNSLANRMGNVLKEKYGIGEDDIVCTLLPEDHWHVALMFAVFRVGGVFSALNRAQMLEKFKYDLNITKPKLLVVSRQFLETARVLQKETELQNVLVCDDVESGYPSLKSLVREAPDQLRITPRSNRDLAIINFTAGTSGTSKGAQCPHGAYTTSILTARRLYGLKASDKNLMVGYLFHNSGIHSAVLCVAAGATNILLGGWDAEKCMRFIEKYGITYIHLIAPTMIRDMAKREVFKKLDLRGISMYLAGEPVPAEVQEMLEERGAKTLVIYGMTETMPLGVLASSMHYGDYASVPRGSAGKPWKEFGEVRLVDPATKQEIREPNVRGEIYFRGDVLTPGYYKDSERTRRVIDEEGWFHTDDLAYFDENGFFYVGGRTDDIISSGAEKLSLIEVDDVLVKHPGVKDAACIGVAHERFGEVPAAFVVPMEKIAGEEDFKNELDRYMQENIERWKRPRLYVFTEEIPRTMGKKTKDLPKLREAVRGIALGEEDGVVTMSGLRRKGI